MEKPLYKITKEMRQLQAMAEAEPEMLEAVTGTIEGMELDLEQKVESAGMVIKTIMQPYQLKLKNEIDRLTAMLKVEKSKELRLVEYLRTNMEAVGKKKVEGSLVNVTCVIGRETVIIDDSFKIPDDYVSMPDVEAKADKTKIMEAHKNGEAVPGTHIERGLSSIRIK